MVIDGDPILVGRFRLSADYPRQGIEETIAEHGAN